MSPEEARQKVTVEFVSADELDESLRRVLDELGLSLEELKQQAATGRFSSHKARTVWSSIRRLAAAS